ncbi:alginate lyase family protein, partial [Streptomyces sp. GLT-R25]
MLNTPVPPRHRRRSRFALVATVAALLAGALAWPAADRAEAAPATFTHPGVTVSRGQLDFDRQQVNAGAQPWKGAYDQMLQPVPLLV